jgi:metallopeptidase MepB
MHNLVSETEYGQLHGTGVTKDFVEVHATVLEKLLTIPSLLRRISCHYSHLSPEYAKEWHEKVGEDIELPAKDIPDELVAASLKKSKDFSFFRSYANLASSLFDMAVHHPESHDALERMNIVETFNRIHSEVRLLHGPEDLGGTRDWGCAFVHFKHISGSYDAQYYTYLRYIYYQSISFIH